MTSRVLLFVSLVLLILILPFNYAVAQEGNGTIRGRVINDTPNGGSVEDITVTIYMYVDNQMAGYSSKSTDEQGEFEFTYVATETDYVISAEYQDVDYYHSVLFEPGNITAYVEIPVCDVTTNDELIKVQMAHTILQVNEDDVEVTEVLQLTNTGNKTFRNGEGGMAFTLPEGACDFGSTADLMQDFIVKENNQVAYLVPFPPGERSLIYSYRIPRDGTDNLRLLLSIDYPTESLDVLVSGSDVEVSTKDLMPAEPVKNDSGDHYVHFWVGNVMKGATLTLGISAALGHSDATSAALWIVAALLVALFTGCILFWVRERRRQR